MWLIGFWLICVFVGVSAAIIINYKINSEKEFQKYTYESEIGQEFEAIDPRIPAEKREDIYSDLVTRAEQGDVYAARALGDMCRTGNCNTSIGGAFKWYKMAADAGDAEAMFWTGYFILYNIGSGNFSVDPRYSSTTGEAEKYLIKAANARVVAAYELLFAMYHNQNDDRWADMLPKAVELGSKYALFRMLQLYSNPEDEAIRNNILEKYGYTERVDNFTFPSCVDFCKYMPDIYYNH